MLGRSRTMKRSATHGRSWSGSAWMSSKNPELPEALHVAREGLRAERLPRASRASTTNVVVPRATRRLPSTSTVVAIRASPRPAPRALGARRTWGRRGSPAAKLDVVAGAGAKYAGVVLRKPLRTRVGRRGGGAARARVVGPRRPGAQQREEHCGQSGKQTNDGETRLRLPAGSPRRTRRKNLLPSNAAAVPVNLAEALHQTSAATAKTAGMTANRATPLRLRWPRLAGSAHDAHA